MSGENLRDKNWSKPKNLDGPTLGKRRGRFTAGRNVRTKCPLAVCLSSANDNYCLILGFPM